MSRYWDAWLQSLRAVARRRGEPAGTPTVSFERAFQASMRDFLGATALELDFKERLGAGQAVDRPLEEYMAYRVDASGAFPMFDLAMLFHGVPTEHWQTPEWQRLRWLAGAVVAIDNDIISYHKDDSIDYVKLQMRTAGHDEARAVASAKQYHHELMAEFGELAELLRRRHPGDASVAFWVDCVFPVWVRGGLLWQCEARRYQLKDKGIMRELFPDFGIPDVDGEVAAGLTAEAVEWGRSCGLLTDTPSPSDPRYPAKKWERLELGLAVLRMYSYADAAQPDTRQTLGLIAKLLAWFFVLDDGLEIAARHEAMRGMAQRCFEMQPPCSES